jgi:hypothetical protein
MAPRQRWRQAARRRTQAPLARPPIGAGRDQAARGWRVDACTLRPASVWHGPCYLFPCNEWLAVRPSVAMEGTARTTYAFAREAQAMHSPQDASGFGPRREAESLRAKVIDAARRAAAAHFSKFRGAPGAHEINAVIMLWADARRDLKLAPDQAIQLWPVYWEAFGQETVRLASSAGAG